MNITKKQINKKGQIQPALYGLLILGMLLIITGFVISFGAEFVDEQRTEFEEDNTGASCGQNSTGGTSGTILYDACGSGYNITLASLDAQAEVGEGQGTVTTVGILIIIVGLLLGVVTMLGFAKGKQDI